MLSEGLVETSAALGGETNELLPDRGRPLTGSEHGALPTLFLRQIVDAQVRRPAESEGRALVAILGAINETEPPT